MSAPRGALRGAQRVPTQPDWEKLLPPHLTTPEQRLALRLCSLPGPEPDEAARLFAQVDEERLYALLMRLNVVTLLGARLIALEVPLSEAARSRTRERIADARDRARVQDLVMLSILGDLGQAGIPAVPLKGSALALAVHGDTALRVSGDIDLLVDPDELPRAVEIAERMGWRRERPATAGLPPLHVEMVHGEMPPLELHWRVHWYEQRFARDALARATAPAPSEPRRMAAADELATLLLFHVRDGLSGLRLPADVIGWSSAGGLGDTLPAELAALARGYPELGRPLAAGVSQLAALVGLPLAAPAPVGGRERAAHRLANPFLVGDRNQIRADASFVDILLAPPGGRWAAASRQFDNVPRAGAARAFGRFGRARLHATHAAKTSGRWCASGARATIAPRPGALGPPWKERTRRARIR